MQGTDVTLRSAPLWQRTRTTLLNAWRRCPKCHGDCWYLRWVDTHDPLVQRCGRATEAVVAAPPAEPGDALWLWRVVMHLRTANVEVRCSGELAAPADAVLEVSARGVRVAFP